MLFNSLRFVCFLPVVVLAYYVAPKRLRVLLLVLASCLFYASWDVRFLPLIIGMTLLNYGIGLGVEHWRQRRRIGTTLLAIGIVGNLCTLIFFKYTLFLLDTLVDALNRAGWGVAPPAFSISIILPLGISFFTFEFIHYLTDIHRGQPAERSLPKFAAFATFFPTQIAGPIKRYGNFIPQLQLDAARPFDRAMFGTGLQLIVVGMFKKVALADNLAPIVAHGFPPAGAHTATMGSADAWLVALAFAFQIYFDFSGYTDIGRGAAILFGLHVPENFARPYFARNISDFWRRWHISLSSWLRDYLYIPLGGNRGHRARNLFITMVLGGLWHGANWTFVVWGAWHGALLVLFWRLHPWWTARTDRLRGRWRLVPAILAQVATLMLVVVGWVFFRAADLGQAASALRAMFLPHGAAATALLPGERLIVLGIAGGCMLVEGMREWAARPPPEWMRAVAFAGPRFQWWSGQLRPAALVCLLALTLLLKPSAGPRFLYFQF